MEVLRSDVLPDVFCGGNVLAMAFVDGLAADVGSGAVLGSCDGLGPSEEVVGLLLQETAAFFLVEKEDGVGGEVLALGGCDGGTRVALTEGGCGLLPVRHDLRVEATVGEDEEAEALLDECRTLAEPGVLPLAGGHRKPEADEVEVFPQRGE